MLTGSQDLDENTEFVEDVAEDIALNRVRPQLVTEPAYQAKGWGLPGDTGSCGRTSVSRDGTPSEPSGLGGLDEG